MRGRAATPPLGRSDASLHKGRSLGICLSAESGSLITEREKFDVNGKGWLKEKEVCGTKRGENASLTQTA